MQKFSKAVTISYPELTLNSLRGEVVSIVPNVKPIFRPMGATAKVDFLLIVEKRMQ